MTRGASDLRTVLAIVHTHWDREWYHPAIRFQARMVALVDAVLATPAATSAPFLLDGQAIVLEDYLGLRPEQTGRIRDALASGELEAGPWYVLADNLIPSGEAIVRNLAAGRRALQRLGASAPPVAYCPDTFGHPAAMPSIARGFGLDVAVVWRGFGGAAHPRTDTFRWRAPDGECVIAYHLPPDGYEFGSGLPLDSDAVRARWHRIAQVLGERNHSGISLLTVGADHHAPPPDVDARLAALQQCAVSHAPPMTVKRSGLTQFAHAVQEVLRSPRAGGAWELPEVEGELRDSYGYTWTLQGTFATRAQQKRANARLERRLLHDVEPISALAWLHALDPRVDGSITVAMLPGLTHHAWEMLLRTHPHDTLCGCSVDLVADAMTLRQREVAALCTEIRQAAANLALGHDATRARSQAVLTAPPTVVRNRVAYDRGGIAQLTLIETLGDVPVGPASGGVASPDVTAPTRMPSLAGCLVQPLSLSVRNRRRESPQHYPDNDLVREHRVLAWVPPVPSYGMSVLAETLDAALAPPVPATAHAATAVEDQVVLENGLVRVQLSTHGITVRHRDGDHEREVVDALRIETTVDCGDSYTPSLRGQPERLTIRNVTVVAHGPLRASARVQWQWRGTRVRERIDVDTILSLEAESSTLRCDVRGLNRRKNHRLQLIWRTDVDASTPTRVPADAACGWSDRTTAPSMPAHDAQPFEAPPPTTPLHRWLCVSNAVRGATLLSDGLAEGACIDGQLAVTLVRAIGELSRADLPERPGHAGWPSPIPAAQSLGDFRASTGLLLHAAWSDDVSMRIERAADALLLPLVGETARDLVSDARLVVGPALEGDGLVASTVCIGADGAYLVLRCRNVTSHETSGRWRLPHAEGWMSRFARLDDTPTSEWVAVPQDTIEFAVLPRAMVTLHVSRQR